MASSCRVVPIFNLYLISVDYAAAKLMKVRKVSSVPFLGVDLPYKVVFDSLGSFLILEPDALNLG